MMVCENKANCSTSSTYQVWTWWQINLRIRLVEKMSLEDNKSHARDVCQLSLIYSGLSVDTVKGNTMYDDGCCRKRLSLLTSYFKFKRQMAPFFFSVKKSRKFSFSHSPSTTRRAFSVSEFGELIFYWEWVRISVRFLWALLNYVEK